MLCILIFFLREQYNCVREKINELGPLVLTKYEFASSVAHQAVKKSPHEVLNRELQAISGWIDHVTHTVNTLKEQLCIGMWWKRDDAKYAKMLDYINNRKFVCVIKDLQGLIVSRLMELDKINLAGSGT